MHMAAVKHVIFHLLYKLLSLNLPCDLLLPGRPTEIDEKDVYICEERYNENDKDFKKLKGLKVNLFNQLYLIHIFL